VAAKVKIADIYAVLRAEGVEQFDKAMDAAGQRAQKTIQTVSRLGMALAGLGAAMTGLAAVAVRAAVAEEDVKDQLDALYGSAEAGTRILDQLRDIAGRTGVGLKPLADGVTALTTYFGDNEEQTKRLIGPMQDLAKYMGVDIVTAVNSVGRAFAGGASDTIALRGPVLALIKDFARLKYGISDISKMELPEFRKMLMEFLTDPTTKFAGHAEKVAKGLGGTFDRLKVAVSELAAAFGKELYPPLLGVSEALIKLTKWLTQLPPAVKMIASWTTSLVGVFALLTGGLLSLLPQIIAIKAAMVSLGITLSGLAATTGPIAVAAAALMLLAYSFAKVAEAKAKSEQATRTAQSFAEIAQAAREAKKGTVEWYQAQIQLNEQMIASEAIDAERKATLKQKVKELRAEMEQLMLAQARNATETGRVASATERLADAMDDATAGPLENFIDRIEEVGRAVDRTRENLKAMQFAAERGLGPYPELWSETELDEFRSWLHEAEAESIDVTGNVKEQFLDMAETLKQAAGTMASEFGRALGEMVVKGEDSVEALLIMLGKLIAKMLIVAALQALFSAAFGPMGGMLAGQFGMGLMGGLGFDEPKMDTRAFRWGFDFARQFREGVSASLTGGLRLPQMQPAPVPAGAFGGSGQFQVVVTEATPATTVRLLRRVGRDGWREVLVGGGLADADENYRRGVRGA